MFAGGPLSKTTGDKFISAGVNIQSVYGATETAGCCNKMALQPHKDWEWISFASHVDIRWDPQGDGSFELQILVSLYSLQCQLKLDSNVPSR